MNHSLSVHPLTDEKLPVISSSSKTRSKMDLIISEYRKWHPANHNVYRGHTDAAWGCAITADSQFAFSGSCDKTIRIWEVQRRSEIGQLQGHTDAINSLALYNKDKYLISASWDTSIKIWDWTFRTEVKTLGNHISAIYSMSITEDEKYLITGDANGGVKIWDLELGSLHRELSCEGSTVFGVCITNDKSAVVTGDYSGNVREFDFNSGSSLSVTGGAGNIQCLTVTKNKKYIIFGTRAHTITVWNYEDKKEYHTFKSHTHWVRNVLLTNDDKYIISCSPDKSIRVFNIEKKKEELKINGSEGFVNAIQLSKDQQYLLACASDNVMRMWKIGFPCRISKLAGHSGAVICMALTQKGDFLVTGSEDTSIRIWSLDKKIEVGILYGHSDTVNSLVLTSNSKIIISCSSDKRILVWDFESRSIVHEWSEHKMEIHCVAICPNDKTIVAGDQDMKIIMYDLPSKTVVKILPGHTDTVFSLVFTKDGKNFISTSADGTLRVWSMNKIGEHERIEANSGMIDTISLSPDQKYLVAGDRNNKIYLWDWEEKRLIKTFHAHSDFVRCLNFSSNGEYFISASNDQSVMIWNLFEERQELALFGHSSSVRCCLLSLDMKYGISGDYNNEIFIWDLEKVNTLELADVRDPIESYLFLARTKMKTPVSQNCYKGVLSPLRINLAHIYAYLGYDKQLNEALKLGTEIIVDLDNHSPLHYALERRSQDCIDVILKYMVEISVSNIEKFLNFAHALEDEFQSLLENSSEQLEDFLDCIFYKVQDITNFAIPKYTLPKLLYSTHSRIKPEHFVIESQEITADSKAADSKEAPIEFRSLPFPIHYYKGSTGSIALLESICNCPNQRILRTNFVKTFVRDKWDSLWYSILALTLIFWANLILMIVLIFYTQENRDDSTIIALSIAFLSINGFLWAYEMVQALVTGFNYFRDPWNIIDIGRISLCVAWVILRVLKLDNYSEFQIITWFMVLLNFFRGLSCFRAFDMTRYYTRLIIKAAFDSISFLTIFFYSTLAFGVMYYATVMDNYTNFTIWKVPYELNMGNFNNTDDFTLEYMTFIMASIINVIIILNLLISILGDSFEAFQTEAEHIDCLEMAEFCKELETLMFWKRNFNEKRFMQRCQDVQLDDKKNWEGRLNAIFDMMQEIKDNFDTKFQESKEIEMKILTKLEALEKRL
ncbi:hypothetical protein SteCoe_9203 [Stentor coeruleus]|uniref:Ion transport domain-containing protein n=1 Tax=Stentor coeruleus TaxID=5963 RepID=A0A1R2CII8_9CILI|nr:hypothetical protein SteCoe_9203 [Stentor coeruleus]